MQLLNGVLTALSPGPAAKKSRRTPSVFTFSDCMDGILWYSEGVVCIP
jgi:hypothetical protein